MTKPLFSSASVILPHQPFLWQVIINPSDLPIVGGSMPFTPYHLGPALVAGLPLRRYLHAPTFILGNLVLDLEGFTVILFGLSYPLHGYLHTVLFAVVVGLLLGIAMYALEKPMQAFYKKIQLENSNTLKLPSFLLAGVLGSVLHVLFDAFLYSEMQPFFPLTLNPLLNFGVPISSVCSFCA